ncbi:MAG: aliphatic sulfonate ABC transporter substrate-binding protein [Methanosarcinaceae archaeon]|nr:aliphatic sulfonate ABC transporter substrate-binding protein [Methanosarcinaceae archaeon]
MKIKGILFVTIMLLAAAFISGCTAPNELNIGYQPSTHQIAHMTAMEKGWWAEDLAPFGIEGINEFEFPTGAPEMQAMLAGDLDIAYVGAAPVISALSSGLDAKIVAGVQTQGSNLVVRPEINYTGPQDLKGLKIATFPAGTIQDTLLRSWLEENNIDPEVDLDILAMGPGDAITAISAGQVDAVFLPHPAPTIIESEGNGVSVLASGEMSPDHACCVLVVSGELIREKPDMVEQIVSTHIKATEYNKDNIDEASAIFAAKTGWEVEKVDKSLTDWDGVWISDPNLIIDSTVDYTTVQYGLGYIDKPLNQEDIFDLSFFEAVMG